MPRTLPPPSSSGTIADLDLLFRGFADPSRLAREGRAARARAEHRFSLGAMVNAYMGVYERVLSRR